MLALSELGTTSSSNLCAQQGLIDFSAVAVLSDAASLAAAVLTALSINRLWFAELEQSVFVNENRSRWHSGYESG